MTDFVNDNTDLPTDKADVPGKSLGVAVQNKIRASEWNATAQAAKDLRSALLSGKYHGLADDATVGVSPAGGLRLRSVNGLLESSEDGGVWRRHRGADTLNVRDFGAVGDGTTDDLAAFNAAIAASGAASTGDRIVVPNGTYRLSGPLHINKSVRLEGTTPQRYGTASSVLRFDAGVDGVIIEVTYGGTSGFNAHLKNLTILAAGKTAAAYGVRLKMTATVEGCYVSGWKTNGIIIDSTVGGGSNCNNFNLTDCAIDGCDGTGVYITGADANAGLISNCSSRVNGGWGFHDTSLTSNTYLQCHTEANTLGGYSMHNGGAGGMLLNCYSEGDQPAPDVAFPAVIIGGTYGILNPTGTHQAAAMADPVIGLKLGGGGAGGAGALIYVGILGMGAGAVAMSPDIALMFPFIAADTVNTATPLFTGLTTGQAFWLYNNTSYTWTFQDNATLPGSGIYLSAPTVTLLPKESIQFWATTSTTAVEIGRTLNRIPVDATGTPGNATQHCRNGRVAVAIGAAAVTVTNKLVTATSVVTAVIQTADATCTQVLRVVPGAGTFTITCNAVATAAVNIGYTVAD